MTENIQTVVSNGACIGCGGCAFAANGKMEINDLGMYQPEKSVVESQDQFTSSCPMLVPELNEDKLADEFLLDEQSHSDKLGKYLNTWVAHVAEGDWRRDGSSGGMGSWISSELLRLGEIDGVIHVKPVQRDGANSPFFRYGISRSQEEIQASAHSHYHVAEISEVLREAYEKPGRYLFIGVPCMVKALRRAQLSEPILKDKIPFTMALICGHLKSINWSLSLGWSAGIPPEHISKITFRVKSEGIPAKAYYYSVKDGRDGSEQVVDSANVVGGKFNVGAMMPNACNLCDDVVGETADITIGDAWLPQYAFDWKGKNMLIVRNKALSMILQNAAKQQRVSIGDMSHSEAVDAQVGGFRQRREGLTYRISSLKSKGQWVPTKREFPDAKPASFLRRVIYRLRVKCAAQSHVVFEEALAKRDLPYYENTMRSSFKKLRRLEIAVSLSRVMKGRIIAKMQKLSNG